MMRRRSSAAPLFAMALLVSGCSAGLPLWTGGGTTPTGRVELTAGGNARVPTGKLAAGRNTSIPERAARAGVSPAGQARVGLSRNLDLGITVSGTLARFDVRYAWELSNDGTTRYVLLFAPGVYGGGFDDPADGHGAAFGADLPLVLGANYGSVVELYVGPRFGLDRVSGELFGDASPVDGVGVRAGGTVGLGTGFRGLLGLLELTVQHEWWSGDIGGAEGDVHGFVLMPSFGLRFRL
ncbi:MAG: hypothetical protein R3A78_07665 [Polyangiales bacterium]